MLKKIVVVIGKLLLCAVAFYFGTMLGGMLSLAAGLPIPAMPAGADAATVQTAMMISGLPVAACLALLSCRLSGNFLLRWLSLSVLVWLAYGVNTFLEASIFSTYGAASAINLITSLGSGIVGGALAAWLFPPYSKSASFRASAAAFFRQYNRSGWLWRIIVAVAAFPAIYYFFGSLISPIVLPYYQQQGGELVIPGLGTLLPVLFLRSVIFLTSVFMILVAWQTTRLAFVLSLGAAMFMLVGGIGLMVGSFLPAILRVVHSLEILADSFGYVVVLMLLFRSANTETQVQAGKIGLKTAG